MNRVWRFVATNDSAAVIPQFILKTQKICHMFYLIGQTAFNSDDLICGSLTQEYAFPHTVLCEIVYA